MKSNVNHSINKDIVVTVFGQVFVLLLTFLINKLVSIYLGPEVYTEYSITVKSAGIFAYIFIFGLGIALPRFIPIYHAKEDEVGASRTYLSAFLIMIISTVVIFSACIIGKNTLSKWIYGDYSYTNYILPLLIYATYFAFSSFIFSYYRALNKFYLFNFAQMIVQTIILIVVLITRSNLLLLIYLAGSTIFFLALVFCLLYFRKNLVHAHIKNLGEDLKPHVWELTKFCLPRVPGEFILFAFTVIPIIILNQKIGLADTAGYTASITINSTITSLFGFVGMVLLPYVSKSIASGEFKNMRNKILQLGVLYIILGICAIIGVEILTNLVIRILFNSEFLVYADIVKIMVISILPYSIYMLLRNPIDAASRFPFNTINLAISFIVLIVMLLLANNDTMYALSFIVAYTLLGILSFISWKICEKRIIKKYRRD